MKHIRSLAAVSLSLSLTAMPAAGQDQSWNPFQDRSPDWTQRKKRDPQAPTEPSGPAPLRPFNGPAGGSTLPPPPGGPRDADRPWGAPGGPAAPQPVTIERESLPPLPGEPPGGGARIPVEPLPGSSPPVTAGAPLSPTPPTPLPASAVPPRSASVPSDLWRGMSMADFEQIVSPLAIPPKSYALGKLWRNVMVLDAAPPTGVQGPHHFPAIQLEALWRAGQLSDVAALIAQKEQQGPLDPLSLVFKSRLALAQNDSATVCATTQDLAKSLSRLPQPLVGERVIASGYCAVVDGNAPGAGLAASLARDKDVDAPTALQALDALAAGQPAKVDAPKSLNVLDYRLIELSGAEADPRLLENAQPSLLVALATSDKTPAAVRLDAAERATRSLILPGDALAGAYRATAGGTGAGVQRAKQFANVEQSRDARAARALLEDARKSGALLQIAEALATLALPDEPIEAALLSGVADRARQAASKPGTEAWRALVELVYGVRGSVEPQLPTLQALLAQGRLEAKFLNKLATVLDAFDVNVPIPLWEAASKVPVTAGGYLPASGVLQRLDEAAKKKEPGRTALLALTAMGPGGPDAVNLLALGETLKALRRAGFEADARLLALEVLLPVWPRSG